MLLNILGFKSIKPLRAIYDRNRKQMVQHGGSFLNYPRYLLRIISANNRMKLNFIKNIDIFNNNHSQKMISNSKKHIWHGALKAKKNII